MPIDFDEIVAGFERPLRSQTKQLIPLFAALAKTFTTWNEQSIAADRATAHIPVVGFRNGGVWLSLQNTVGDSPRFGDELVRGGRSLVDGLSVAATSVNQELLLFRLSDAGVEVSATLRNRTEEVLALKPSMFDVADASFFDLPALGAIGVAMADEAGLVPSINDPARPPVDGGTQAPLQQHLDDITDLILATFLVLPAATTMLSGHGTAVAAAAQVVILQQLQSFEQLLLDYRGEVVRTLLEVTDVGEIVELWIDPLISLLVDDVLLLARWIPGTVDTLLGYLVTVVSLIDGAVRILVPLLRFVGDVLTFLFDMDLLFMIPGVRLTPRDVVFNSIRDWVTEQGERLQMLARVLWLSSTRDARIAHHLGQMLISLGGHTISLPAGAQAPTITPVPDVAAMVLTPRLETAITDYLWTTMPPLGRQIATTAEESGRALTGLGASVQQVADRSRNGVEGLAGAVRQAISLTEHVMADETARLQADVAADSTDDPGVEFVSTATFGAGTLMPYYVMSFRRIIARRSFDAREPSPHILARRARLVGVQSPKLTVSLTAAATDDNTAELVANALRTEFSKLYSQGVGELDRASAAARAGGA